jgi:hypothetical protein
LVLGLAAVPAWAVWHGEAGPPIWLVVRRSLDPALEVKYDVSDAGGTSPLEVIALVAYTRSEVDKYLEDRKRQLEIASELRMWAVYRSSFVKDMPASLFVPSRPSGSAGRCDQTPVEIIERGEPPRSFPTAS